MKLIAAISAVIVVAGVFACLLPAQDQRSAFEPLVTDRFGKPPVDEPPRLAEPIDVEPRIASLADQFSKALVSALQEKVISVEQADRMVKELEVVVAVKQARLDLLRVGARLDKVTAEGVLGSEELQELRRRLKELEPVGHAAPVVHPERQTPAIGGIKRLE